jgi:hypothetical protein
MEITTVLPVIGQELPSIFGDFRGFSKFQNLFHVSRGSPKMFRGTLFGERWCKKSYTAFEHEAD